MDRLRGSLLVASPVLEDPNFARTVVLLLDHGPTGALGVVLNRPTDVPVPPELPVTAEPAVMFSGGPVATDAAIALGRGVAGDEAVVGDLGVLGPERIQGGDAAIDRLYAGYAGWGAGQLEAELQAGGWIALPALLGDVLTDRPGELWRHVLRRQGGRLAWLSNAPDDLSWN